MLSAPFQKRCPGSRNRNRNRNLNLNKNRITSTSTITSARLRIPQNFIFVLASVAPLLGLLGTAAGIISTFEAISRFGTANTRALAAGISEALITTQIGLIVAVPGLFMRFHTCPQVPAVPLLEQLQGSPEAFHHLCGLFSLFLFFSFSLDI